MSGLRLAYLALALWGAVHPMVWFVTAMRQSGRGVSALSDAWFSSAATTGLAWDMMIAAVALTVWILAETSVRRNWIALVAIPAIALFGIGCALPFFLFLRAAPIR